MTYTMIYAQDNLEHLIDLAVAGETVIIAITEGVGVQLVPVDAATVDVMRPDVS